MRTAAERFDEYEARGWSRERIRLFAIARDDAALVKLVDERGEMVETMKHNFEVIEMPLDSLRPSRLNRRIDDNDPALARLVESLREEGLIQPIVARYDGGDGDDPLEIVCGERRWRAAKKLGWATIPCILRADLDEAEAHALRITENLQREDVPPLEQASGVATLLDRYDGDVGEVARRLGQSETWVRLRARLTDLSPRWREELADPETPYARLAGFVKWQERLARLPASTQDALWQDRVLLNASTEADLSHRIGAWLHKIADAPWDEKKQPRDRRCKGCRKRSDFEADLFGDLHDEDAEAICLDPACWDGKVELWLVRMFEAAAQDHPGLVVITDNWHGADAIPATIRDRGVKTYNCYNWSEPDDEPFWPHERGCGVFLDGARRGEVIENICLRAEVIDETETACDDTDEQAQARREAAEAERKAAEEQRTFEIKRSRELMQIAADQVRDKAQLDTGQILELTLMFLADEWDVNQANNGRALNLSQLYALKTGDLEALARNVIARNMDSMDFSSLHEATWFLKNVCGMSTKQISAALKAVTDDGEGA